MPQHTDEPSERIGRPDPRNEPKPPKLDDAGQLGPVGERKLDDAGKKEKEAIWQDRGSGDPLKPAGSRSSTERDE